MAVMKKSVAFDPAVGREALDVAGEGGFSRFVNDAVAQRLQAIRIEALYQEHLAAFGPIPRDLAADVATEWEAPPPPASR